MGGFVQAQLSAAGKPERGREAPPLVGDLLRELDALGLQIFDGRGTSSHIKYSS